ncbi:MAG: hypothetical protein HRU80_03315 [Ignavibacteriales bacterium]|nr:MAG: hypothetical protein HRU80_03315 [Ignavibacteriales bacterium]
MKTSVTGYLLFTKDLFSSTKYTKTSQAGEIPKGISTDVLYLIDRTSQAVRNMIHKMKGDYLLRSKGKEFQTSLFICDSSQSYLIASGDIKGTETLLILFLKPGEQIEIFIAPGKKKMRGVLLKQIQEGKFSKEITSLRKMAAKSSGDIFNDSLNFDISLPEIDLSFDLEEQLNFDIPDPMANLRALDSDYSETQKPIKKRASGNRKKQRGRSEKTHSL